MDDYQLRLSVFLLNRMSRRLRLLLVTVTQELSMVLREATASVHEV